MNGPSVPSILFPSMIFSVSLQSTYLPGVVLLSWPPTRCNQETVRALDRLSLDRAARSWIGVGRNKAVKA